MAENCTCCDVIGENIDCPSHGIESQWSLDNRSPDEWQEVCIGLSQWLREAKATSHGLREDNAALLELVETGYHDGFSAGDWAAGGDAPIRASVESWNRSTTRNVLTQYRRARS